MAELSNKGKRNVKAILRRKKEKKKAAHSSRIRRARPRRRATSNGGSHSGEQLPRKKKRFGQHFLHDFGIIGKIIDAVEVRPETTVVEIGPGSGNLTLAILEHLPAEKVIAYEIDREWAEYLRNNITDSRFTLIEKDVLKTNFSCPDGAEDVVLMANLPYNVATEILTRLAKNPGKVREAVVMIQDEVAKKVAAPGGRVSGPISLVIQNTFDTKLLAKVPPHCFTPKPKVTSRLLHLLRRDRPRFETFDNRDFWKFVNAAFSAPRRMLRNNLKPLGIPEESLGEFANKRAQELDLDTLHRLWKQISQAKE